jgi:transposase
MRWHGRRVTVYAYARPTDMRKGFDGLCALVTQALHRNPLEGDVFLFVSRDRVRAKTIHWDGTGYACMRSGSSAAASHASGVRKATIRSC